MHHFFRGRTLEEGKTSCWQEREPWQIEIKFFWGNLFHSIREPQLWHQQLCLSYAENHTQQHLLQKRNKLIPQLINSRGILFYFMFLTKHNKWEQNAVGHGCTLEAWTLCRVEMLRDKDSEMVGKISWKFSNKSKHLRQTCCFILFLLGLGSPFEQKSVCCMYVTQQALFLFNPKIMERNWCIKEELGEQ